MNKQYVLLTYGLEPLIKGYICDKFMRPNNNQSNNTHLKTIPAMYLSLKRASLSNIGRLKVQFLTSLLESTILVFWDIPCCVLKIAHFGSPRRCLPYRGRILTKLHFRQGEIQTNGKNMYFCSFIDNNEMWDMELTTVMCNKYIPKIVNPISFIKLFLKLIVIHG